MSVVEPLPPVEAEMTAHYARPQTEPDGGEALLRQCAHLLRRGDSQAGRVLQQCLAAGSGASPGWVEIGDVLLDKGKTEAALLCFAKGPPSTPLFLRAGLVARDLGRRAEALAWFTRVVELDPSSTRGWFLLGTSAQDAGDLDGATEAYRAVLRLDAARTEAEVNLGICLQAQGRLDEAKGSYARAVRLRPDSFGRVAQALPGAPKGELWLDLAALRRSLAG